MKLGNACWGYREMGLDDYMRATVGMGLKYIELSCENDYAYMSGASTVSEIEAVRRKLSGYGLVCEAVAAGNDFSVPDYHSELARVKRAIDVCARLGAVYLRIFAGFCKEEEITDDLWRQVVGCLQAAGSYAHKRGVILAVEVHGGITPAEEGRHFHRFGSLTTTGERLSKLIDETECPAVRALYDPANFLAYGGLQPQAEYPLIEAQTAYVHLKDYRLSDGCYECVACGDGQVNWQAVMAQLSAFQGTVYIEYEQAEDIVSGTERSLNFIKRFI